MDPRKRRALLRVQLIYIGAEVRLLAAGAENAALFPDRRNEVGSFELNQRQRSKAGGRLYGQTSR
jgi:hypothetical protein